MGPLNNENKLQVDKSNNKTEKTEKSFKNFKNVKYKLSDYSQ